MAGFCGRESGVHRCRRFRSANGTFTWGHVGDWARVQGAGGDVLAGDIGMSAWSTSTWAHPLLKHGTDLLAEVAHSLLHWPVAGRRSGGTGR